MSAVSVPVSGSAGSLYRRDVDPMERSQYAFPLLKMIPAVIAKLKTVPSSITMILLAS